MMDLLLDSAAWTTVVKGGVVVMSISAIIFVVERAFFVINSIALRRTLKSDDDVPVDLRGIFVRHDVVSLAKMDAVHSDVKALKRTIEEAERDQRRAQIEIVRALDANTAAVKNLNGKLSKALDRVSEKQGGSA